MRPLPWNENLSLDLCDIFTELEIITVCNDRRIHKRGTVMNPLDIFNKPEDSVYNCRRIKVEGPPAIGKSVFCRKLAYDWACDRLDQFNFLFLIEFRQVVGHNTIEDIIFEQLLPDQPCISKNQLRDALTQQSKSTLYVLDALDEMGPKMKSAKDHSICKLIHKKLLPWCTVVTTTRPHECDRQLSECDSHFRIKGFTLKRVCDYIMKYFVGHSDKAIKLIKKLSTQLNLPNYVVDYVSNCYTTSDDYESIQDCLDFVHDTLCNPLHVSFLCLIWEDHQDGDPFPEDITQLYGEILDCVLNRACAKQDPEFIAGEYPPEVITALDALKELAFKSYKSNNMMINENDISNSILSLGLLVRDTGISRTKPRKLCYFYHKTWREYFTALYVRKHAHDRMISKWLKNTFSALFDRHDRMFSFVFGCHKGNASHLVNSEDNAIHLLKIMGDVYLDSLDENDPYNILSKSLEYLRKSQYDTEFLVCISEWMPWNIDCLSTCNFRILLTLEFGNNKAPHSTVYASVNFSEELVYLINYRLCKGIENSPSSTRKLILKIAPDHMIEFEDVFWSCLASLSAYGSFVFDFS
ncbi:protein NLRC5-like [Saccoglossus kowalevskii]